MGPLFCLLSAVGFGAMGVFGKLAYDAGVSVDALLLIRFGLAATLLLVIASARGALRGLSGRSVLIGLGMGGFGYAVQAGLYFSALARIDASLVALLLYVYPVLVVAAAVAIGRERASRQRVCALGIALAGIVLVLSGAASGRFDVLGALMALGAALTYTGYILVGDRAAADVPPLGLAALVCTGATATLGLGSLVRGGPGLTFGPVGWLWLAALALVSTVVPILLFFAGLARVGPSVAAILSILEPVVTVVGAASLFGESLTAAQLLGGALVLAAVLVVQWPTRRAAAHRHRHRRRQPQPSRAPRARRSPPRRPRRRPSRPATRAGAPPPS